MTVVEKMTLKRKLTSEIPYVGVVTKNTKMGHGRKLSLENDCFVEKNTSVKRTSSLVIRIKAHSVSDSGRQLSFGERNLDSYRDKDNTYLISEQSQNNTNLSSDMQNYDKERHSHKNDIPSAQKYATSSIMEGHKGSSFLSMEADKVKQCYGILNKLMTHKYGWVFNQPVDPVKLNIPDYFSIITEPMDLGTIKTKLGKKQYSHTTQFVKDVRLTFSNAMRYNPPSNDVHIMAKILKNIFNSCWRSLEARMGESETLTLEKKRSNNTTNPRPKVESRVSSSPGIYTRKVIPTLQSQDMKTAFRKEAVKLLDKGSVRSSSTLKKCSIRNSSPACKVTLEHEEDEKSTSCSDGISTPMDVENVEMDRYHTSPQTIPGKELENPFPEEQLSPTKALRAAILKSRFADTIFRAEQKKLLDHGDKTNITKLQEERIQLEKKQQEEKARIQAQIRAAEEAVKRKDEEERKMKIEKERRAARLAVQNMEKTVDIYENSGLLQDLQILVGTEHSEIIDEMVDTPGYSSKPLEKLGLFMKEDDMDDDVEIDACLSTINDGSIEEGEIGV